MLPPDVREALHSRLEGWVRDRDLSGRVLLTGGGRTLFEGSYGLADRAAGVPVTARTRFALASVTKMFTAVAVADLVRQGRLAFDDRVVDVLPPERRPATLRDDVTVHHLLCHTSGIADYCEEDEDSPAFVEDYGSLWDARPSYAMLRPADYLPMFGDLQPYRPPGEQWQYSNAGYVVLGLVVEEISGRHYAAFVEKAVFEPAGMTASGFFRFDEARPDVAVGYLPREPGQDLWRSNIFRVPVVGGPDGGAFATSGDLDRFLTAYGTGSLLGPLTDSVLAPHADVGDGFACGYGVIHAPDGRYGHGGGDPGAEAILHRFPADDVNLVVLCNMEGLVGEVRDAVLEAWRASA